MTGNAFGTYFFLCQYLPGDGLTIEKQQWPIERIEAEISQPWKYALLRSCPLGHNRKWGLSDMRWRWGAVSCNRSGEGLSGTFGTKNQYPS